MSQPSIIGVQLPNDGSGKITGAIKIEINGSDVYLPATVLVDSAGIEIGQAILDTLSAIDLRLQKLETLAIVATEALTR